jgi:hypothetical protein
MHMLFLAPYTYVPWYRRVGDGFGLGMGFILAWLVVMAWVGLGGPHPHQDPLSPALGCVMLLSHAVCLPLMAYGFEQVKARGDAKRRRWGWID